MQISGPEFPCGERNATKCSWRHTFSPRRISNRLHSSSVSNCTIVSVRGCFWGTIASPAGQTHINCVHFWLDCEVWHTIMLHKYEQTQQTPYQLHKSCYSKVMIPLSIRGQSLNTRPYKLFLQSQKTIFSEFLITLFWEAVIYNESWRGLFAALCLYSISYLIGAELTFVSLYVLQTSFRLSTSKGLKTKAVTFYLSFYFFATKFQNQKTSDQKYNINFWNQYTEYIFFYLCISYPGQKNTEQVQISRDSAKSSLLFYIADYVVSRWTSRSSSPITYSSLVRHSPKTYSTKWQKTSPGANNFQLSMTAMHQFEQNVHPVQPPPSQPPSQLRVKMQRCLKGYSLRRKKKLGKCNLESRGELLSNQCSSSIWRVRLWH